MSKLKILITGSDGLVASRVIEIWQADNKLTSPTKLKSNKNSKKFILLTPSLKTFNLLDLNQITKYLSDQNPDIIIHFAAYTDVTTAEQQTGDVNGLCWQINVQGTKNLLTAIEKTPKNTPNLIHISTDMVFPGSLKIPGPYTEVSPLPQNHKQLTWYGWTKLQAEKLVADKQGTIIRIIYPVRTHHPKLDFLRKPLELYKQGQLYPLFNDQTISITYIDHLADVLIQILNQPEFTNQTIRKAPRIYHVSSRNTGTIYDFMTYILNKLGHDSSNLKTSSIIAYLKTQPNPNRFPIKGGLDTTRTEKSLGMKFPTWQEIIDSLIKQGLK